MYATVLHKRTGAGVRYPFEQAQQAADQMKGSFEASVEVSTRGKIESPTNTEKVDPLSSVDLFE